ncbi:hypothetical protein [Rhizosaccharibacter radicis]
MGTALKIFLLGVALAGLGTLGVRRLRQSRPDLTSGEPDFT